MGNDLLLACNTIASQTGFAYAVWRSFYLTYLLLHCHCNTLVQQAGVKCCDRSPESSRPLFVELGPWRFVLFVRKSSVAP